MAAWIPSLGYECHIGRVRVIFPKCAEGNLRLYNAEMFGQWPQQSEHPRSHL